MREFWNKLFSVFGLQVVEVREDEIEVKPLYSSFFTAGDFDYWLDCPMCAGLDEEDEDDLDVAAAAGYESGWLLSVDMN